MSDSMIQPGAFVRDHRPSTGKPVVGKVAEADGDSIRVDFWNSRSPAIPQRFLSPLPGNAPEVLLWERPEELASWVSEAPLRLVALALSLNGGKGKAADVKDKLSGRVIAEEEWDGWWKKHSRYIGALPDCFESVKASKGNDYSLLTSVDDVPTDWKPPAKQKNVTLNDWKNWLSSGTHVPPPGDYPTRPVQDAIAKWPAETIEQALLRLIVSAEEALASDNLSTQAAGGWLRAVAQASLRWRESAGKDTGGYTAARVGGALARLSRVAGDRTPQDSLLQAGVLDGETAAWRRGFLAGMWEAFDGDDARNLYRRSSAMLGRQARADLMREIVLAAFGPDFTERRRSELDRLLDSEALSAGDRLQLLREVIARADAGQSSHVAEYIANSRHAVGAAQLPLRAAAALMLSGGREDFADRTSRELADAFAAPESYGPELQALFKDTAARVERIIADKDREMAELRESHAAELERERREQERLRQQVRERNAELDARREESRLEIRKDMLLAVGEVLQAVACRQGCADELAGNVEAGLRLALRAGGADLLDTAPEGKVVAPGVIVRDGIHGDLVLLPAQVKYEAS